MDQESAQEGAWEQVALYDTEELAANMWYQVRGQREATCSPRASWCMQGRFS